MNPDNTGQLKKIYSDLWNEAPGLQVKENAEFLRRLEENSVGEA